MKSAEAWYIEYSQQRRSEWNHGIKRTLKASDGSLFRAIQLDAMKEGAKSAAARRRAEAFLRTIGKWTNE